MREHKAFFDTSTEKKLIHLPKRYYQVSDITQNQSVSSVKKIDTSTEAILSS